MTCAYNYLHSWAWQSVVWTNIVTVTQSVSLNFTVSRYWLTDWTGVSRSVFNCDHDNYGWYFVYYSPYLALKGAALVLAWCEKYSLRPKKTSKQKRGGAMTEWKSWANTVHDYAPVHALLKCPGLRNYFVRRPGSFCVVTSLSCLKRTRKKETSWPLSSGF